MRTSSLVSALILMALMAGSIGVPAVTARKPQKPPPPAPSVATGNVMTYAEVRNGAKCEMTPEVVEATSDGGSILLAHSGGYQCEGGTWIVKLDASGAPQWQEEVRCAGNIAGFDLGTALRQTADGGYVIAGGIRDCETDPVCTYLTSVACGLVEKLDANGNLVWSRVFRASPSMTTLEDIWQTSDGGFVATGTFLDANSDIGALVLKLDSQGNAQWKTKIGPDGRKHALLYAVQQTPDGGYLATGNFYTASADPASTSVFLVRLDADGNVRWQRAFNSFDTSGAITAVEKALAMTQTSDGGFAVAGVWADKLPGACCEGSLLMKFDANGNSQWQKAYSGGTAYFYGGSGDAAIGGIAYSVHQATDGGYVLAGAGDEVSGYVTMRPWLAKTDVNGNLVWQHFYYDYSSQYFASSDVVSNGYVALGFTVNRTDHRGELFSVRTDSAGQVGSCGQIHPATPLEVIDPKLTPIDPRFPVARTTTTQEGDLPSSAVATSVSKTVGSGC